MRRRAASSSSMQPGSRSTASATRSISRSCATLGVPFWLAGGYGNAGKLREALEQGAAGIQVGTAFAFSRESGHARRPEEAADGPGHARSGRGIYRSAGLADRISVQGGAAGRHFFALPIYQERKRVCDLGYLREPYAAPDGKIGYRCAAEPVDNYVAKGGKIEDTVGRKCLCNALMANMGHAQTRKDEAVEPALVTVGDDLNTIAQLPDAWPGYLQRRGCGCVAAQRRACRRQSV